MKPLKKLVDAGFEFAHGSPTETYYKSINHNDGVIYRIQIQLSNESYKATCTFFYPDFFLVKKNWAVDTDIADVEEFFSRIYNGIF